VGGGPDFGLPRVARMRRRRDFARTIREGRTVAREAFVVHGLAVPAEGRRLGVVCGRRVGNAAVRNRAKRRSAYALEAVRKHGPWRGSALAAWRILRCNPFNAGGHDPVP
jgi:RNase P protein component